MGQGNDAHAKAGGHLQVSHEAWVVEVSLRSLFTGLCCGQYQ